MYVIKHVICLIDSSLLKSKHWTTSHGQMIRKQKCIETCGENLHISNGDTHVGLQRRRESDHSCCLISVWVMLMTIVTLSSMDT